MVFVIVGAGGFTFIIIATFIFFGMVIMVKLWVDVNLVNFNVMENFESFNFRLNWLNWLNWLN